jgi:hypothetical protein
VSDKQKREREREGERERRKKEPLEMCEIRGTDLDASSMEIRDPTHFGHEILKFLQFKTFFGEYTSLHAFRTQLDLSLQIFPCPSMKLNQHPSAV